MSIFNLAAGDTIGGIAATGSAITYTIGGMELASGVETYKKLAQGQLAISAAALYTVPGSTQAFLESIILANTTGSPVSGVILYNGGTAASNQITGSLTIPANGTLVYDRNGIQVFDASGNLYTTGTNSFGATVGQDTTPLADGTAGVATLAARNDHTHQSPGSLATISGSVAISNTEARVVGATLPANYIDVIGKTFRVEARGVATTSTSPGTGTFRIRLGPTTLTANIPTSIAPTLVASASALGFTFEALITARTIGSGTSMTLIGECELRCASGLVATLTFSSTTATVTGDSTVQNMIELTYVTSTANGTFTFHVASIDLVKM